MAADYQTAKNDYTYQYSLYREKIDSYQVAKSTYQTYRTLTAQNDAIVALRVAVQSRDRVISTYYNLLQEKLNETPGISPEYRSTFSSIKESEKSWLATHQKKIDAAATLEDLNAAAAEFETHYPQFDRETKQTIGTILLTKEANLKKETDQNIDALNAQLILMRQSGEKTDLWDRGLITVKNKLDLYDQKIAQTKDENIETYKRTQLLVQANQYLREAVSYLLEIIKSVTG